MPHAGPSAAILLTLASVPPSAAQAPLARTADRLVSDMRQSAAVPGLAFVLVRNDAVLLLKGYGTRELQGTQPVDERTLFAVGSFTKGVTATALAILVDEGKLRWDDPVRKHLAGWKLSDPWVADHVTVRDLVSLRLGLPGGDAALVRSGTPAELIERVGGLPVGDFRAELGVAPNLSFTLAGEVVASVSGKSWEEFVTERLLGPLGMAATKARLALVKASNNLALPHRRSESTTTRVEPEGLEHMMAAAALYSTAVDVGQWIRLHLGQGRRGDRQIVSEASMKEMHTPQALSTGQTYQGMFNRYASVLAYGLGWVISDYKGHKVLEHGGVNGAYTAYIVLVPGENTGFAVLTNLNMGAAWRPIQDLKFQLLDAVIGSGPAGTPASPR